MNLAWGEIGFTVDRGGGFACGGLAKGVEGVRRGGGSGEGGRTECGDGLGLRDAGERAEPSPSSSCGALSVEPVLAYTDVGRGWPNAEPIGWAVPGWPNTLLVVPPDVNADGDREG